MEMDQDHDVEYLEEEILVMNMELDMVEGVVVETHLLG